MWQGCAHAAAAADAAVADVRTLPTFPMVQIIYYLDVYFMFLFLCRVLSLVRKKRPAGADVSKPTAEGGRDARIGDR